MEAYSVNINNHGRDPQIPMDNAMIVNSGNEGQQQNVTSILKIGYEGKL